MIILLLHVSNMIMVVKFFVSKMIFLSFAFILLQNEWVSVNKMNILDWIVLISLIY